MHARLGVQTQTRESAWQCFEEGSHLLEGEKSCTHLNGTAEGDLAISLAEVHVSHTQVGSLNEHREVYLFPTANTGFNAEDADVMTIASGSNASGI